jgi:hypothetical protein
MRKKSNNCRIDPTIQATYMVKISLGKISPPEVLSRLERKTFVLLSSEDPEEGLYHMCLV